MRLFTSSRMVSQFEYQGGICSRNVSLFSITEKGPVPENTCRSVPMCLALLNFLTFNCVATLTLNITLLFC